ncbi:MAG TPA: hypothetical protein VF291_02950, partial [Burkholderiaceae bacterium]
CPSGGRRGVDFDDYLRDQATMYRELAGKADDPAVREEMLDLAAVCEEVADHIEDLRTGG